MKTTSAEMSVVANTYAQVKANIIYSVTSVGRRPALQAGRRRFESVTEYHMPAQLSWLKRETHTLKIGGPNPPAGTKSHNRQDSVDLRTPFKVVRGSENNLRRGEVKEPRNMGQYPIRKGTGPMYVQYIDIGSNRTLNPAQQLSRGSTCPNPPYTRVAQW